MITANLSCRKTTLILSLAGLASALCTMFFAAFGGGLYLAGFLFGAAMSITLLKLRIFSERQAWRLFAVTIAADVFSFLTDYYVQLQIPLPQNWRWSMDHGEAVSPISLLAGGMVGGFLFFGEALYLLRPRLRATSIVLRATLLSLLSGVLAVIGWALGPYLGTSISEMFYASMRHTTVPVPTPYDPLYGYRTPTVEFPVYLVWQLGVAFALGIIVRYFAQQSRASEGERR